MTEDLNDLLCPHSAAGRPERFPAKACILAGECGCVYGAEWSRALRLADECEESARLWAHEIDTRQRAAAELRRLHVQSAQDEALLRQALEALDSDHSDSERTQQPANDEVVFIDGVGAARSSIQACRDGVQWIMVGDRVYWPLSDADAQRLQSACCGNGHFDGPATPTSEGEQQ